jgi:hypothetical protein
MRQATHRDVPCRVEPQPRRVRQAEQGLVFGPRETTPSSRLGGTRRGQVPVSERTTSILLLPRSFYFSPLLLIPELQGTWSGTSACVWDRVPPPVCLSFPAFPSCMSIRRVRIRSTGLQ